ncbi:hypothetical protein CRYUN_Cryun32bG0111000 [Craigia yunnanensis]
MGNMMKIMNIYGDGLNGRDRPLKYLSTTVFESCSAELLRDFYMDTDYRKQWDKTLLDHMQLQMDVTNGIETGRTVKKFPLLTPREYILAWRLWEGKDGTFYCFIKECEHLSAPRQQKYVRVGYFRSGWQIRKGKDASEIRMFHQEDAGLNVEMAKLAFAKGICSYVCKMDNALRKYSLIRHTLTSSAVSAATLIQKVPPELDTTSGITSPADSASMAIPEPVNSEPREKKLSRRPSKKLVARSLLLLGGAICMSCGHSALGAKVAMAYILKKLRKRCDSSSQSRQSECYMVASSFINGSTPAQRTSNSRHQAPIVQDKAADTSFMRECRMIFQFFKGKSFLESNLRHNSSFTWQSLWATKKTLMKGLRWRVGNGEKIKSMEGPWIPKITNFIPSRTDMETDPDTVSELTEKDIQQWGMQMIRATFQEDVGDLIQSIPLGKSCAEDVLVWSYEEKGCYTVKSGYRVLMANEVEGHQQGEENGNQKEKLVRFWRKLWAAKVPSKIKMCLWKMSHDFLPVLANLFKKRVCTQITCQLCGSENETVIHAVKNCSIASEVWRKTQMYQHWQITDETNISEWLSNVTEKMDQ